MASLRVLGPLQLEADDRPLRIGGHREHITLAMLADRCGRVTPLDLLIHGVWGDDPPSTARGQIQSSISEVRKSLARAGLTHVIETHPSGYVLHLGEAHLDVEQFRTLVATAQDQAGHGHLARASDTLREALALWRGPAMAGVRSDDVRRAGALIDDLRLNAVENRVRLDLELGRHEDLVAELQSLVADHPWRERLHTALMLALHRCGRSTDALGVFRRARARFVREMGIEPGAELRELEHAILRRDPTLELPDLGLSSGAPHVVGPPPLPRLLPTSIADFVGRAREEDEARSALVGDVRGNAVPVVAIFGRGGTGKSALAVHLAHRVAAMYPDGQLYADLRGSATADLRDTAADNHHAVLAGFLRALGFAESAIPGSAVERQQLYRSAIADKRVLVVLDGITTADQTLALMPGSASCAAIVVSRRFLAGLPTAHAIGLGGFDDHEAFEFLARLVGPERLRLEPAATAELMDLCARLPLALRIAGARLVTRPHWSIMDFVLRLREGDSCLDEFECAGLDVRATFADDYELLPQPAQRLFRLFGTVDDGTLDTSHAAALLDVELRDADSAIQHLLDGRMVTVHCRQDTTVRFGMDAMVRAYARELLARTDTHDSVTAARHRVRPRSD